MVVRVFMQYRAKFIQMIALHESFWKTDVQSRIGDGGGSIIVPKSTAGSLFCFFSNILKFVSK